MHDLIVRDGIVVDGTGAARFRGDVAVRDGRIVQVGAVSGVAKRTIDAGGCVVTPGFVDIHTHYDGQVSWDRMLAPSSINGVTSAAMGNCGVGFAPARADKHDWLIQLLEGVEDIPGTALAEGLTWDWESFPDYLDALSARDYTMDLGAHLPHAALRAYVMGDRGGDHLETPTAAEIDRMATLTGEALEAGALGFTTSRTHAHRARDGANIGTLTAGDPELLGIVAALKRADKGVIQLISDAYLTADDDFAAQELALIRRLAETSGRRLSFTVQQSDDSPDRWKSIYREIDAMVADGLPVSAQVAPRPIGAILSFASTTNPFILTPTYRTVIRGSASVAERLARLAEPGTRAAILTEHDSIRPSEGFAAIVTQGYRRMFRMTDPVDYEPQESQSIAAEAARAGADAAAYAYDTLMEDGGRRLLYMPLINYARGNLDDVHGMMTGKHVLYGLSDGGAHCGTICDGSFPTTTIGLWSKGSKSGLSASLESLVHGYTKRNAAHVGWHDRGVVAPGYLADLNVIALDDLALAPPEIVQDLPAGGARLLQQPRGYRWTVKSGVPTFENGAWTGETPGRLLRGAMAA
ncbi:amidohydrolase family protein [Sphingomonas sp. SUN019]|uniref:N-acyl-D-amino-acid deacylase family protein n=1 Tax=Sphingomonas sp. SUN019 TaxID=2937788 RepID=UPI0021645A39|nr:amidohydrolase family protein [Sphingomonas sp. SUN019]UVO50474.1 amidohydrolase family protein [Sphingomonas sp. SUN019]